MNTIINNTIQELGLSIIQDNALVSINWTSLYVVFKIDGNDIEEFGELMTVTKTLGYLLDGDLPGDLALKLCDEMNIMESKRWKACKVTIIYKTQDINIEFEYEDEMKWNESLPF